MYMRRFIRECHPVRFRSRLADEKMGQVCRFPVDRRGGKCYDNDRPRKGEVSERFMELVLKTEAL